MNYSASLLLNHQRYPLELSRDELQKYPDSLLAQMADSGAGGVVDLDSQPNNPLREFADPSAAITCLYRHGRFDEIIVNSLVASCQECCKSAYVKAKNLLSYLGLPGPVTSWLTDINHMSLRSARTATFTCRTVAIESVDSIMGIQPFKDPMASNPILFLIQEPETGTSGQLQLPKIYTLVPDSEVLMECLSTACNSSDAWDPDIIYHNVDVFDDQLCLDRVEQCVMLPPSDTTTDLADVVGLDGDKVIGARNSISGSFIKEELQSACKEAGLVAGCVRVWTNSTTTIDWPNPVVPVWCLKWRW